ncbi:L,D-transpeptidase [Nevskia sp.]|uniref:L,D-transpeptidase n=1 Tax=Nevskia sp. TaxID=1929292 RepID=UPI0025FADFA2|nr:L,D-transpeptidase [Nevskia sp.]
MTRSSTPKLEITVSRSDKMLSLVETIGSAATTLLTASIVSGCEDTGTPAGVYKAGKWIKDKTNSTHGPTPWSQNPWGNPYGPFFLPLNDAKTGKYTTYGIHGTRGPRAGNFEKPPLPQGLMRFFVGEDEAKFLYCSHGCIRVSNQNISKIFELTTKPKYAGTTISVTIK